MTTKTSFSKLGFFLILLLLNLVACEHDDIYEQKEESSFFETNTELSEYEKLLLENVAKIIPDSVENEWRIAYGTPYIETSELLINERGAVMLIPFAKEKNKYDALLVVATNRKKVSVEMFSNEDILSDEQHILFIRYAKMQKEIGNPIFQKYRFEIEFSTKARVRVTAEECTAMYIEIDDIYTGEHVEEFKGWNCKETIIDIWIEDEFEFEDEGEEIDGACDGYSPPSGGSYHGEGGGGGTPLPSAPIPAPAPDHPVEDIEDYLKCLDTEQEATLTIYVDQPVANSGQVFSGSNPGHAFVSLKQGKNISVFGFYPNNEDLKGSYSGDGICGNDSNHEFDISIETSISAKQLKNIINYVEEHNKDDYHLRYNNCTDFAIQIAKLGGLYLPDTSESVDSNPARFGQDLRVMEFSETCTLNSTGGKAPKYKSTCEE